ncbi:MAG: hypothetical protein J5911_05320 [Clostridia bacterium]|nr:hypothetical protein [Clostridia bacterium]
MEDFNSYAKNFGSSGGAGFSDGKNGGGLFETVSRIAKQFDGKGTDELLRAIYDEAKSRKKAGTLTNAEIDGFVAMLSPALDSKKRRYLQKIAEDLKKI